MANNKQVISYSVMLSMKEAKNQTAQYKQTIDDLADALDIVDKKLAGVIQMAQGETVGSLQKERKQLEKEIKLNTKNMNDLVKSMEGVDDLLKRVTTANYNELTSARTVTTNALKRLRLDSQAEIDKFEKTSKRLQIIRDEINKRNIELNGAMNRQKAEQVLNKPGGYSTGEVETAIKTMQSLQSVTKRNSQEWRDMATLIENGKRKLEEWSNIATAAMAKQRQANLSTISTRALEEQRKYWQQEVDGADQGSKAYASYMKKLEKVNKELNRRKADSASSVMKDLDNRSLKDIQDAIKVTEQLRDAQKLGSRQWNAYNNQIVNARDYLQKYADSAKQAQMEKQWKNITKLSTDALEEQRKYWQQEVDGAQKGSKAYTTYLAKLQAVNTEISRRKADSAGRVMNNLDKSSVNEIQDAIRATEQLRDAQTMGDATWTKYNDDVLKAKQYLADFNAQAKMASMNTRLTSIDTASTASIEEQRKYWQTMRDGAAQGSPELKTYADNLQKVVDEEKRRKENDAVATIVEVNQGWSKSVQETEDAIKLLKEYRSTLNINNVNGLKLVDDTIAQLNEKLDQSKGSVMSLQDALNQIDNLGKGQFNGTIEDLEKLKQRLMEFRKTTINLGGQDAKSELAKIDAALQKVDKSLASANGNIDDFNEFIQNINSKSMVELKAAAEQLSKELENTAANEKEFIDKSRQLREVNRRIDEVSKKWKEHRNVVASTAKRLASYVLVYAGFNKITGYVRNIIGENLKLSDSFADIRKTTGLTEEAVRSLSKQIDDIDTRTSQESLHQLAVVAGQIGLRSSADILGFVKASNQINVALSELGEDGTATLMKLAQLTGDVGMGVEKSLLSIGSAINELSANSAATAAPIVDMMSRLGGIAAQANISTADMAALGASFDALNQPIEMAGTSLNKFIAELMSKTENVAYALNMDAKYLKTLISTGQTTEAMLAVWKRMNEVNKEGTSGFEALNSVMGDLGSEGARMSQILRTAAGNVEFIRAQVELSREAFAEATSVTNEYNVKNENAMAMLLRIGNMFRELFVNADPESWISNVMRSLHQLIKAILDGGTATKIFVGAITALVAGFVGFKAAMIAQGNAIKRFIITLKNARTAAEAFRLSFLALSKTMKASIFGLVAAAAGYLIGHFVMAKDSVDSLTRAIADHNKELSKQQMRLTYIRDQLLSENLAYKDKLKYISELNKNYGEYLGFVLKDTDSTEKLTAAIDMLNAETERRLALQLQTTIQEKSMEKFSDKFSKITEYIGETAKKFSKYKENQTTNLMELVTQVAEENVNVPIDKLSNIIKERLQKLEDGEDVGGMYFYKVKHAIADYMNAKKEYSNQIATSEKLAEINIEKSTDKAIEKRRALMNEIKKEYEQENAVSVTGMNEDEQRAHYTKLAELDEQWRKHAKEQMKVAGKEEKENIASQTAYFDQFAEGIRAKLITLNDAWGKGPNLRGWREALDEIKSGADLSGESLDKMAAAYKNIEQESKKISDVKKYNDMFGTSFKTLAQVMEDTKTKAGIIRAKLKEYGRGVTGEFLWGSDGSDREGKRKAREEYQAALAALEAYYAERETMIRQEALKTGATEAELNRQMELLNMEHWSDQQQLYMTLLDEFYRKAAFRKEKFVGPLSGLDYFKKKDLDALRVQLAKWGVAMEDGMKKQLMQVGIKISEQARKVNLEIEKILLEDNYTEQVLREYTENIDRLGLLYNVQTESEMRRTKQNQQERMALLRKYAEQSYNLTADQLRQRMSQESLFSGWVKGRKAEEYDALLVMLRKYHDDVAEAEKKMADRRKKIFESSTRGLAIAEEESTREALMNREKAMWERFEGLDLTTDDVSRSVELDYYKQKIRLSQLYIDSIHDQISAEKQRLSLVISNIQSEIEARSKMGLSVVEQEAQLMSANQQFNSLSNQEAQVTSERRQQMQEDTQQLTNLYMEHQHSKLTELKKYTDALVTFSGSMGEAAFGEVEDRKEAGRQLIKSLLTTLKEWTQVKLTELVMKQMFAAQSAAIEGQEVVADLTMTGAKASADVAAGTASATAKEAGKLGLGGLLVGAAIGAALSALLGIAMSAISKSKSTVSAASGTGTRLATGMLTYAQGKYPVLGNDGRVYDARYEGAGMKTGVYSGGPRVGIFSEKQPEAVIDGRTTRRLVVDYPGLWQAILSLSRGGSLPRRLGGVRTYAQGNLEQLPQSVVKMEATGSEGNERLLAALEQSNRIQTLLMERLSQPIEASINMYGERGLKRSMDRANKFSEKRKIY